MKSVLIIAATAALAAAAWATPSKAVEEDFEGSRFPPPGWTKSGEGKWYWENPGGYAKGCAWCGAYPDESRTILASPLFRVNKGTALRIEFRYHTYGGGEASRYILAGRWWYYVTYEDDWVKFDQFTLPFPAGGEYRVEFKIYVAGGSFSDFGNWYLDDVLITRDNVAVDPASLGRVKALFK